MNTFDSIRRLKLLDGMKRFGIPSKLVKPHKIAMLNSEPTGANGERKSRMFEVA